MDELINKLKSLQDDFNAQLKGIKDEYLDNPSGLGVIVNLQGEVAFTLNIDTIKNHKR